MKAADLPKRRPAVVELLEPADFSDRWGNRPDGGIAVGLRFISDYAEGQARKDASRAVSAIAETADIQTAIEEYNDELMARVVGASICDPNDVSKDPENISFAEDTTRSALRSSTIRRLFNRIEAMRAEHIGQAEADDDELGALAELLAAGDVDDLDDASARRVRRLAVAMIDLFR